VVIQIYSNKILTSFIYYVLRVFDFGLKDVGQVGEEIASIALWMLSSHLFVMLEK
jgi:hypothetical protein